MVPFPLCCGRSVPFSLRCTLGPKPFGPFSLVLCSRAQAVWSPKRTSIGSVTKADMPKKLKIFLLGFLSGIGAIYLLKCQGNTKVNIGELWSVADLKTDIPVIHDHPPPKLKKKWPERTNIPFKFFLSRHIILVV